MLSDDERIFPIFGRQIRIYSHRHRERRVPWAWLRWVGRSRGGCCVVGKVEVWTWDFPISEMCAGKLGETLDRNRYTDHVNTLLPVEVRNFLSNGGDVFESLDTLCIVVDAKFSFQT